MGAEQDERYFKPLFLDVGLVNLLWGLELPLYLVGQLDRLLAEAILSPCTSLSGR